MSSRPQGRLRSFPRIVSNIKDLADDDDALIRLHEILFSSAGSKTTRKRHILEWATSERSMTARQISQIKTGISETPILTVLKEICVMLDANVPAGRPNIEQAILRVLVQSDETIPNIQNPALPRYTSRSAPAEITFEIPSEPIVPQESESGSSPSSSSSQSTVEESARLSNKPRGRKGGRKKGSRNKTPEQREADRQAWLMRPKGRPGRKKGSKNAVKSSTGKQSRSMGKQRGRPMKFSETRAFKAFVESKFPDVYRSWTQMAPEQRLNYWVRYKPNE
jgi:hypothetical protein